MQNQWASQAHMESPQNIWRIDDEKKILSGRIMHWECMVNWGIIKNLPWRDGKSSRQLRNRWTLCSKEKEPSTMNQLFSQIRDSARQGETPLNEEKEFLRSGGQRATLECPPRSQSTFENSEPQRYAPAAILDCRNIHGIRWGTSGKCFSDRPICYRKNLCVFTRNCDEDMEKGLDNTDSHDFPGMLMIGILRIVLEELKVHFQYRVDTWEEV